MQPVLGNVCVVHCVPFGYSSLRAGCQLHPLSLPHCLSEKRRYEQPLLLAAACRFVCLVMSRLAYPSALHRQLIRRIKTGSTELGSRGNLVCSAILVGGVVKLLLQVSMHGNRLSAVGYLWHRTCGTVPVAPYLWHRTCGTAPVAPYLWHRTCGSVPVAPYLWHRTTQRANGCCYSEPRPEATGVKEQCVSRCLR